MIASPDVGLQQILQAFPPQRESTKHVAKVLQRIRTCRTAALGYHVYGCSDEKCQHKKYQYHSCRDRHCPNCGYNKQQDWVEARLRELLPVKYYHVVFTLPHELNGLVMGHRKELFKLLFDTTAATLMAFAKDEKYIAAVPGIISVMHTWGQQLSFHPHIHCIVSGGGITKNKTWVEAKGNGRHILFPVKALSVVYRAKFLEGLKTLIKQEKVIFKDAAAGKEMINNLYQKGWVVYAKAPFGGPAQVLQYLGRYTHKVAISNHRIISCNENGAVTLKYKDYSDHSAQKLMTLEADEFIRRFAQHILPARFCKIRSYGYLANRNRTKTIKEVLCNLKLPQHPPVVVLPMAIAILLRYGTDILQCPCCKKSSLKLIKVYRPWKRSDDG